jgi:hypothetical protein
MRFALVCLFTFAAVVGARGAEVEFQRVWPGWRDADSFDRVLEYFTGKEYTGQEIILRTQAKERGGFYFLARVKNPGPAVVPVKFKLQIVAPNDPAPKTFSFPANLPAGTSVFNLGLTGADWTDQKNPPVAWKLELLREDGQVMATEKSFLWEHPAK